MKRAIYQDEIKTERSLNSSHVKKMYLYICKIFYIINLTKENSKSFPL